MENVNLCKELEDVREQISKIVDDAIKRLYEARDRLAKVIAIDMGLIKGETDKYGALTTYLDLVNMITAVTIGVTTVNIDIDMVLENLGCKAKG
jgi:chorismate mutase